MSLSECFEGHIVVFDCNVYLTALRHLSAPFSIDDAGTRPNTLESQEIPAHDTRAGITAVFHSLALANAGPSNAQIDIRVFSSQHILDTTLHRATGDRRTNGLGLAYGIASDYCDVFIREVINAHDSVILGSHQYDSANPPAPDYEDGNVLGTCVALAGKFPLSKVWCVTRDKEFQAAVKGATNLKDVKVVFPEFFVSAMRAEIHSRLPKILAPHQQKGPS